MDPQPTIDDKREVILALQLVADHLALVRDEPSHWKWVILSLHDAFEGLMVLALWGKNGLTALTDECAASFIAAYERRDGHFPQPELDTFSHLYKKVQSDRMISHVLNQPFKPTAFQTKGIKRLDQLHRQLPRFLPRGWSLDIAGLAETILGCTEAISFLAFDCGNVEWRDESLENAARTFIEQIRKQAVDLGEQFPRSADSSSGR